VGVPVLTNATSDQDFASFPKQRPRFETTFIQPAGIYNAFATNKSQVPGLVQIVNAINNVRATNAFTRARKTFSRLGELLAVPELTVASPFLNTNSLNLQTKGISEAAYERIPQQILGLLHADPTPRFVIYSYGQSLKPADKSIITSGPFFGLCTNYQITAEVGARAVVRIEGVPVFPAPPVPAPALTNLHVVVESFNILPPD
jgi:hypothetical protein